MTEEVSSDAMIIAILKNIEDAVILGNSKIDALRSELERNDVHLKYEVDLSVAHTDKEIADFTKMGLDINSIIILPVPSALSIRLRGLTDETISLSEKQSLNLNNHKITRLIVTNTVGSGTAEIHTFGKMEVKTWVVK